MFSVVIYNRNWTKITNKLTIVSRETDRRGQFKRELCVDYLIFITSPKGFLWKNPKI